VVMGQIGVFDVMKAIVGGYHSYTGLRGAQPATSIEAAVALAAHDTLVALFPSQKDELDQVLVDDLGTIREGREGGRHHTRPSGGRRNPGATRRRRVAAAGASRRRRFHHEQPTRKVATGSGEPGAAGARRSLGGRPPLRAYVGRSVPGASAAGHRQPPVPG